MYETRVTITLGCTGKVVKRGGSKRFSDGFLSATKRPRVDEFKWSSGGNRFNDSRGTQYDLRLKLMRKRRMEELRKRNLREKQLKLVQRPGNANTLMLHQSKGSDLLRQYPSRERLGDCFLDNSMQKYYPFQTKNGSSNRPPSRTLSSSRRRSPPRTSDELRQVPVIRAADVSRDRRVWSNEVVHASRPTATATMKGTAQTAKPVPLIFQAMPKSSLKGVDNLTVSSLLYSLGLEKYATGFDAEEVDMAALRQMSDKDLKELGVPMGPRKKILRALQSPTKLQPDNLKWQHNRRFVK